MKTTEVKLPAEVLGRLDIGGDVEAVPNEDGILAVLHTSEESICMEDKGGRMSRVASSRREFVRLHGREYVYAGC